MIYNLVGITKYLEPIYKIDHTELSKYIDYIKIQEKIDSIRWIEETIDNTKKIPEIDSYKEDTFEEYFVRYDKNKIYYG